MRETVKTAPRPGVGRDEPRHANGHREPEPAPAEATNAEPSSTTAEETPGTASTQIQFVNIGEVLIVHQYGRVSGQCGTKGGIMTPDEEEDMEAVESPEVTGGRLISVAEAVARTGLGRTTIHKALKYIRHARWKDAAGKRDVVLLYEDSFNEWLQAPAPIRRQSRSAERAAS